MYKGEQIFMKVDLKNNRAYFLKSLRNHKLKPHGQEVVLKEKRKNLGSLGIRIGLRGEINKQESIGTWIEAKKKGFREK